MNGYNETGEIRQLIVITDGKSNIGMNPAEAAEKAARMGMVVSVIGIADSGGDRNFIDEVEHIAKAGGGLTEYTSIEDLGKTVQHLTRKTAQKTIEQIISRQLRNILGAEMESLDPQYRLKIAGFIEKYGDLVNLKCIIALDTSGSMKNKLEKAKKCLVDLLESLKERKGDSRIAAITFPGEGFEGCRVISGFTDNSEALRELLATVGSGGGTPTGPAILKACELMNHGKPASPQAQRHRVEDGQAYGSEMNYI